VHKESVGLPGRGVRLVADRWDPEPGQAAGPVLLLHGGGQTRHSWKQTGARLSAAGWTAVAVDTRGHGDSDWPADGDYSLDALVADVVAVAGHLDAAPVLVGASLGGYAALVAQGENPALGRALVLVDIVPRVEARGTDRIGAFMRSGLDGFDSLQDVAAAISAHTPGRRQTPSEAGVRKNVRLRQGRWYWHWDPRLIETPAGPDQSSPQSTRSQARALSAATTVRVPTLIVRGVQSDVVSDRGVAELRSLIPAAEYVSVDDAGHMIVGDDNDVFTAHLVNFLRRCVGPVPPS